MDKANQTIRQIAIEHPSATNVFDRMGIAYCWEGTKTLKDACSAVGASLEDVSLALEQASAGERARQSKVPDNTLEFLVLRVLRAQHEKVKQDIPPLLLLAASAAEENGARHPEVTAVGEELQSLSSELMTHLNEEEESLFPALLQLELAYLGENPVSGYPRQVRELLTSMAEQHGTSGACLRRIFAESSGFRPPEHASPSHRDFYQALQKFYEDLHNDLHTENNILFPQAARMETEIFRGYN